MPWREVSVMDARAEFCELAIGPQVNMSALCQRFGISRKTGYKWLARWRTAEADTPLGRDAVTARRAVTQDRSRRPHRSPGRSSIEIESVILAARDRHPTWGARKIIAWLQADPRRCGKINVASLPSASTANAILKRHGRIDEAASQARRPLQRFERAAPNELWQMDFKGHVRMGKRRCHPLTVLDDHSRYAIGLQACGNERGATVQARLTTMFKHYGLPERILCDNGPPWGTTSWGGHSALEVWLMRLGVRVSHGRPYHPQTQGKDERFHRTLREDVLDRHPLTDLRSSQRRFDRWRTLYNDERPHQALDFATPASRYRAATRQLPSPLPPIEYPQGDTVRKVHAGGRVEFGGYRWRVGRGFIGQPVGIRPTQRDGEWDVYYCEVRVTTLDVKVQEASRRLTV